MRIEDATTLVMPKLELGIQESSSKRDFVEEFWDVIESLDATQKEGQQKMTDVATGKSDDSAGALVALEKASLQFEIATTIRDKGVYAFNKLLETQI